MPSASSSFANFTAANSFIPQSVCRKHDLMPGVAARWVMSSSVFRSGGNRQVAAETVHGKPHWCCELVEDIHTAQQLEQPGTSYPWLPLATQANTHVMKRRRCASYQHHSDDTRAYLRRSLRSAWGSLQVWQVQASGCQLFGSYHRCVCYAVTHAFVFVMMQ